MPWNSEEYSRLWNISTILSILFTAASAYWGYVAHRLDLVAAVGSSDIFSRFVGWTLPLLPLVGTVISPTPQRVAPPTTPWRSPTAQSRESPFRSVALSSYMG